MARGGKRTGAGRKRGKKSARTLEREAVLEAIKQRTMRIADRILDSQLALARGQSFLYKIEKEKIIGPKGGVTYKPKKPVRVIDEYEIAAYLERTVGRANHEIEPEELEDRGATYYFITTKEPENAAIDSIFDRTFGRPKQSLDLGGKINIAGVEILVRK